MFTDFQYVTVWIFLLFGIWIGVFPILWLFTKRLADGGFGVGFPFSSVLAAWIVWMLSSLQLMPFSLLSSIFSLVILFSASIFFVVAHRQEFKLWMFLHWRIIALELLAFVLSLSGWSIVRSFQPDIQGLEKFMDAGFVNSILRSPWMPPQDMWFAPLQINYYYFGHFVAAFLTLLSGIDSGVTYNLLLASVFASSMVGGFSVVFNFANGSRQGIVSGIFTGLLLNFGGNLHTAWHFLSRQGKSYWYPDATRFIPYTIHEFPAYSHVVADLHGHLMDFPVVLLFFVLLIAFLKGPSLERFKNGPLDRLIPPIVFGFLLGIMSMTNMWDVPIYGLIFLIIFAASNWKDHPWKWGILARRIGISVAFLIAAFFLTSFPFHLHFKNFAKGITFVEARSPIWQLGVLWGGFLIVAFVAVLTISPRLLPFTMIGVSFFLVLVPEVIYIKDIYIKEYHRANTMFKLTYQSFSMMCLVFGMTMGKILQRLRTTDDRLQNGVAIAITLVVFTAQMAYPFFSIKSYYELTNYRGLYGLQWFADSYPDDYQLLAWMKKNIQGAPVILEAVGESYTDYSRFSTFSGLPTVLGWRVHEWLWRGSFDEPQKRTDEVKAMYETPLIAEQSGFFQKFSIRYIVVGSLERKSYTVSEKELLALGKIVSRSGNSYILELE